MSKRKSKISTNLKKVVIVASFQKDLGVAEVTSFVKRGDRFVVINQEPSSSADGSILSKVQVDISASMFLEPRFLSACAKATWNKNL